VHEAALFIVDDYTKRKIITLEIYIEKHTFETERVSRARKKANRTASTVFSDQATYANLEKYMAHG
jgi:hypothetical protein